MSSNRKPYKILGIARALYKIGSASLNFVLGQATYPVSQTATNELDVENTSNYKNGILGITHSGDMPQPVLEDVASHLDNKYEDLIKNAGLFLPKPVFEEGEVGYNKNAVVYTQNEDNTITFYISQVDNNKSTDLTDTNYWVKEATIPGIIDGSKLILNNLSDTAKENIKNVFYLDSSDFSLLKTSLDNVVPINNKELNGDTITSATIVVPERIKYLKTKLTPAPDFTIVNGEPSVDLKGCYLISMAQRNLITSTYNGDCKYYTYIEGSDTLILPTVKDIFNQLNKNKVDLDGANAVFNNIPQTAKNNIALNSPASFYCQNVITDMDFNNYVNRGSYYISAYIPGTTTNVAKTNSPYGNNAFAGTLVVQNGDNNDINFVFQRFNCATDGRMWYRVKLNGVWQSWIEIKNKYIPDYTAGIVVSSRLSFTAPSDGVLIGWVKYIAETSSNSQDIGVYTNINRTVRIAGINSNSEYPVYNCFNIIVKSGLTYGLDGQEGSLTFYPFIN